MTDFFENSKDILQSNPCGINVRCCEQIIDWKFLHKSIVVLRLCLRIFEA
jgi:hypothetical protein